MKTYLVTEEHLPGWTPMKYARIEVEHPDEKEHYPEADYLNVYPIDIEKIVAEAISDHEQTKWKKYPENKPDRMTLYLCQCESDGKKWTEVLTNPKAINYWIFAGYQIIGDDLGVIAFRELPAPYEPKTE